VMMKFASKTSQFKIVPIKSTKRQMNIVHKMFFMDVCSLLITQISISLHS